MDLNKVCSCLNNETQIEGTISEANQIDSALSTTNQIDSDLTIPKQSPVFYTGVDSSTIKMNIDNSKREISADLIPEIPTKTSQLENDDGFITAEDLPEIPEVPTKTSELLNDSGYITEKDVPKKVSELENDSGFITKNDIPDLKDVPTKTSELVNDSGFVTSSDLPTKTSDLTNDSGFITDYTEDDPTVPQYVKDIKESDIQNWNSANNEIKTLQTNVSNLDTNKVDKTRKINNKSLATDITLTSVDVSALPNSTKYGASLSITMNTSTYVVTAQLKDQNGNNLGTPQTIDLPLESVVVSGTYNSTTKEVVLTLQSGSTIKFSVADLVSGLQKEITASNKLNADLVDDSTSANKFVTAQNKTDWNNKYVKPASGIPASDLAESYYLASNPNGYTKVEKSSINGNIKINDTETPVYTLPDDVARTSDIPNDFAKKGLLSNVDIRTVTTTGIYEVDLSSCTGLPSDASQFNWDTEKATLICAGMNNPKILILGCDVAELDNIIGREFYFNDGFSSSDWIKVAKDSKVAHLADNEVFTGTKTFDDKIVLNDSITRKDGKSLLSQTDTSNIFGDLTKLLLLNSYMIPKIRIKTPLSEEPITETMAFTSDIPTLNVTNNVDASNSNIFQASMSLGGLTIKFGVDYLIPEKDTVTSKTITFNEPFTQYCAGVVTGCSSASTLRTTNLKDYISLTGLTVAIYRTNTTGTYFSWIAVGI